MRDTIILYNIIVICNIIVKINEAAPRFELGVEDLQSTALPLGYTAIHTIYSKIIIKHNLE